MKMIGLVAVLLMFLSSVAFARGPVPESSYKWAERLLNEGTYINSGNKEVNEYLPRRQLRWATDAFNQIIYTYGPTARAYKGLARTQMALGKYEAAIKSLSKAQSLSLPDKEITDLSRQAKDLAIVANAAVKMVPKDNIVLRVMRYANSRTWVVLSAKVKVTRYSEYSVGTDVNDVHLTVLRGSPNRIRRAWQSRALGQPGDKYDEAQIEMLDVTGDGRPEVLLINSVLGADSLPTYLAVFRKQGTSLRKIFGGWSREPQTIEDLDGDGSREITIYYRIGWSLGVAGMPFWSDIHSFKKGAYQLANGDFPGQYNDLRREIRDSLKDSPGDFELLLYLGRIYEIQKQPYKALVYYRRALKSGYGELAEARSNGWGHLAARATSEISSTRQRIRAISRKRRADHY